MASSTDDGSLVVSSNLTSTMKTLFKERRISSCQDPDESFSLGVAKKRYQAVGFPCNRMLKLSSSRGIRIDLPVLSVSWSFEDHSVIIQALRIGLIEHEASDCLLYTSPSPRD